MPRTLTLKFVTLLEETSTQTGAYILGVYNSKIVNECDILWLEASLKAVQGGSLKVFPGISELSSPRYTFMPFYITIMPLS